MGFHRIPPIAVRLGLNRGFESAWYADGNNYAKLLQKDWLISRAAWSYVQRSSRTLPKSQLTREQQLQLLSEQRRMIEGETPKAVSKDAALSLTPAKAYQQKKIILTLELDEFFFSTCLTRPMQVHLPTCLQKMVLKPSMACSPQDSGSD